MQSKKIECDIRLRTKFGLILFFYLKKSIIIFNSVSLRLCIHTILKTKNYLLNVTKNNKITRKLIKPKNSILILLNYKLKLYNI